MMTSDNDDFSIAWPRDGINAPMVKSAASQNEKSSCDMPNKGMALLSHFVSGSDAFLRVSLIVDNQGAGAVQHFH
jgi:ATP-dependent Zn protease